MKVTQLGTTRANRALTGLLGGSGAASGAPSGQVPTADGSNGVAWGSNIATVWSNGSNQLIGPHVNFASGANIALSAASNTLTIIGLGTGGGGGAGDADAVLGQSGAGQIRIPGLTGSPDIRVGAANDDEFDTTDTSDPMTGWTTLGTPTAHDINSTRKSHYYVSKAAGSISLSGIRKTPPSYPYTMTVKLTDDNVQNSQARAGIFVAESSPGKIWSISRAQTTHEIAVDIWTSPTTFSSQPNLQATSAGAPLYLRIVAASTTDVTFQWSFGGMVWRTLRANADPTMTIGTVGLFVSPGSTGSTMEALFDWVRFS